MSMKDATMISVAIATFNREEGLRKLLAGLLLIDIPNDLQVSIVVADNSNEGNAREIVESFDTRGRWQLSYAHVPERGISFPRNQGIEFAINNHSRYLVYIDDDEVPEKRWLVTLIDEITTTRCAAVTGAVKPVFEKHPYWWIEKGMFFSLTNYPDKKPIEFASTGNIIIDMDIVKRLSLRFNPEFALSGGEDTFFFNELRVAGYETYFCKDAVIYEDVPTQRATLKWLLKRWYRTGNTDGLVEIQLGVGYLKTIRVLLGGMARIVYGIICGIVKLPLLPFKNPAVFECIRIIMRGAGYIGASMGIVYLAYKDSS